MQCMWFCRAIYKFTLYWIERFLRMFFFSLEIFAFDRRQYTHNLYMHAFYSVARCRIQIEKHIFIALKMLNIWAAATWCLCIRVSVCARVCTNSTTFKYYYALIDMVILLMICWLCFPGISFRFLSQFKYLQTVCLHSHLYAHMLKQICMCMNMRRINSFTWMQFSNWILFIHGKSAFISFRCSYKTMACDPFYIPTPTS